VPTGGDLVASAKKYLGDTYVFGGNPAAVAGKIFTDCSGFFIRAVSDAGVKVTGRTTYDLVTQGRAVPITGTNGLASARPGDALFFFGNEHMAMYEGNGQLIEDSTTGQPLGERAVYATPDAIRRFIPDADALAAGGTGGTALTGTTTETATNASLVTAAGSGLSFVTGGAAGLLGDAFGSAGGKIAAFAATTALKLALVGAGLTLAVLGLYHTTAPARDKLTDAASKAAPLAEIAAI
jgi:hypothetical protein